MTPKHRTPRRSQTSRKALLSLSSARVRRFYHRMTVSQLQTLWIRTMRSPSVAYKGLAVSEKASSIDSCGHS